MKGDGHMHTLSLVRKVCDLDDMQKVDGGRGRCEETAQNARLDFAAYIAPITDIPERGGQAADDPAIARRY